MGLPAGAAAGKGVSMNFTHSRGVAALWGCLALAGAASAQPSTIGTGRFWWEASLDGGSTWARDALTVADPSAGVLIRARADWEPRPPEIPFHYFAGVKFDVVVESVSGGLSDGASHFTRAPLLGSGLGQTYAAMRFGSVLKIDDIRDTLPPGEGTRAIEVHQYREQDADLNFRRNNPMELFRFILDLDGSEGERIVRQAFRPYQLPEPNRFLMTYLTGNGAVNYPDSTAYDLRLHVVPAPGAAGLLVLGTLLSLRGRRRC